ncbi:TVP38/TMEM64 family protein [Evansella sp. AB-rgal1]|uniref:TVP38/TMEM64 family protein n=1 Tax=Evansella sp. AB-rgal1 TaxID=3242696 RepID=UPI00359EEB1A
MPSKIKILVFLCIIILLLWLNHSYLQFNPVDIQRTVLSFGWLAPIVFIVMLTIRPFILFPASLFGIAGGLSFGPLLGPIVTYIGSLIGASISFLVVRKFGDGIVQKQWRGKGEIIQNKIEENSFYYVLTLRILPIINFDLISYLSGLSRIEYRHYILATMIGIIPGTLAFNFFGASFVHADWGMIAITIFMFLFAFMIPYLIRKKLEKKNISIDFLMRKLK